MHIGRYISLQGQHVLVAHFTDVRIGAELSSVRETGPQTGTCLPNGKFYLATSAKWGVTPKTDVKFGAELSSVRKTGPRTGIAN